jgi:hypothetical protein
VAAIEYMTRRADLTGALAPQLPRLDAMLAEAGRDGWKLVATVPTAGGGASWEVLFVFMRER